MIRWAYVIAPFTMLLFLILPLPARADACDQVDPTISVASQQAARDQQAAWEVVGDVEFACGVESPANSAAETRAFRTAGDEYARAAALGVVGGHNASAFAEYYLAYNAYGHAQVSNKRSSLYAASDIEDLVREAYSEAQKYKESM